jgi:hypothetical protein
VSDKPGETALGAVTPDGRVVAIFPLPAGMGFIGRVAGAIVREWKKESKEELAVLELNADWSGWKPVGENYKTEPGSAVTFTA